MESVIGRWVQSKKDRKLWERVTEYRAILFGYVQRCRMDFIKPDQSIEDICVRHGKHLFNHPAMRWIPKDHQPRIVDYAIEKLRRSLKGRKPQSCGERKIASVKARLERLVDHYKIDAVVKKDSFSRETVSTITPCISGYVEAEGMRPEPKDQTVTPKAPVEKPKRFYGGTSAGVHITRPPKGE